MVPEFLCSQLCMAFSKFAFISVALSAMQVVIAVARSGKAFENASCGFSIAALFLAAGTASVVLLI